MEENKFQRKNNETYLQYVKRLTENKRDYDLDYIEWEQLILGEKLYSSENCRKGFYLLDKIYKKDRKENENNIIDKCEKDEEKENLISELENKKIELKKERIKLNTLRTITNRDLREIARIELYLEQLDEAISKIKPLNVISDEYDFKTNENKVGLLGISDIHFGKQVEIRDLKGKIINKYNEEVFKQRMNKLYWKTVNIVKKENLKKLVVFNLSDCIDGILRISQLKNLQYGIIDSVLKFSEYMAEWLNKLSEYIPIEYYQAWGNHDEVRLLTGKKGDFPEENVNRLIMEFIQLRLKDNKKIIIHNENQPYILSNILGLNVFGFHGECKNISNTLKDIQITYKQDIDLCLAGHLHNGSLNTVGIGEYGDIQCIRVPSICGIDDYSMKLLKTASAGSNLFIIEKGRGKTITYDINLNIF